MQVKRLIVSYSVPVTMRAILAFFSLSYAEYSCELKNWTWYADLAVETYMDSYQFAKYTVIIL